MMQKVFMFSGQGSQYFNMGKELFDSNDIFRKHMLYFEYLMMEYSDTSLLAEMYNPERKHEDFDDVLFTHPGLFAIQVSLSKVLLNKGIYPDRVIGYSLGEYVAAAMAGIITIEEGFSILIDQSIALSKSSCTGGMMVILGDISMIKRRGLLESVSIAAENYEGNITVSGRYPDLVAIKNELQKEFIYTEILPIKYPFHSPLMDVFEKEFLRRANRINFNKPLIPFYSCATASEMTRIDARHLWSVIRDPIFFESTVDSLGASDNLVCIDLSPSGTLSSLIKYGFKSTVQTIPILSKFGNDVKSVEGFFEKIQIMEASLTK